MNILREKENSLFYLCFQMDYFNRRISNTMTLAVGYHREILIFLRFRNISSSQLFCLQTLSRIFLRFYLFKVHHHALPLISFHLPQDPRFNHLCKSMLNFLGVSIFTSFYDTKWFILSTCRITLYTPYRPINGEILRIESMSHLTVSQFVIRVFMALCDTDTEALRSIMAPGLKSPADRPRGGSTSTVSTITGGYNGIKEGFLNGQKASDVERLYLLPLWSIYVGTVYMYTSERSTLFVLKLNTRRPCTFQWDSLVQLNIRTSSTYGISTVTKKSVGNSFFKIYSYPSGSSGGISSCT